SLVVVLVARDRVDPGQHLGHRLQVEAPLASGTVRRLLERELAPQLERAATPERVEAGQVAPAPLVSGRGSASFALAGQRGEGQVRAGDGPPPEARILHAAADAPVHGLGGWLDVEAVRELAVQRVRERAGAGKAGAEEH